MLTSDAPRRRRAAGAADTGAGAELLPGVHTRTPALGKKLEPASSPFLLLSEAAAYLRVSPAWLERSDCPRVMLGRRRVYHVGELERFALSRLSHRVDDGE